MAAIVSTSPLVVSLSLYPLNLLFLIIHRSITIYYNLLFNTSKYRSSLVEYLSNIYLTKYQRIVSIKSIECMAYNLTRYIHYDLECMYLSGVKSSYKEVIINGKQLSTGVSYNTTKNIFDMLEDSGQVIRSRGYKYDNRVQLGCYELTEIFKIQIKGMVDMNKVRFPYNGSSVVLRGADKEVMAYSTTREIQQMIRSVNKYNKLMARHKVQLLDKTTGELREYPTQAVRIFSRGDFSNNGRFYLTEGSVQTLPATQREDLLIDDVLTGEADLKGVHLAIAHEMAGSYWMQGYDPYNIYTESITVCNATITKHQQIYNSKFNPVRNLIKIVILIMINSDGKVQAKEAIKKKIKEDKAKELNVQGFVGILDIDFDWLFECVIDHHKEIEDCFFSDKGIQFMRLDSDIIGKVLDWCTECKIPCIPIHDSVIYKTVDMAKVISFIKKAYLAVLGTNNNCIIEVK